MSPKAAATRSTFPKSHHLRTTRQFDAVYAAKTARRAGPLRIHALANDCGHHRLGLSVSARVGGAVVRNRIKRMLRESFRLLQHQLPGAYDLVVVAMPHAPLTLADYQRLMRGAVRHLHEKLTAGKSKD